MTVLEGSFATAMVDYPAGEGEMPALSIDPVSGDNTVELLFISANKVEEGDFFWFEKEMAEYSESGAGKVCEKI